MNRIPERHRVGELRPSQLLFTFGVGAVADLPSISVMVMGLDDWNLAHMKEVGENRLLAAVRAHLGPQVNRLYLPPLEEEPEGVGNPFDPEERIGVPVAPFPRWMRCPWCSLLAPLSSGLFQLKPDPYRPDRTKYVHANCPKSGRTPAVIPARFLVACEAGHLDDFPWSRYVHRGGPECKAALRLREQGASGEAADIWVTCDGCNKSLSMAHAFGDGAPDYIGRCRRRRPHLRDFADHECPGPQKAILLGASNSWFPISLSALSIPSSPDRLGQLVDEYWTVLEKATTKEVIKAFREIGQLRAFGEFSDDELWSAIESKRADGADTEPAPDLKAEEWRAFSNPEEARSGDDFRLRVVDPPEDHRTYISRVVLAERLREVRALIGFTRIESPGDFADIIEIPEERRGMLSRRLPEWVPVSEVRGEGIFIQFDENLIMAWIARAEVSRRAADFFEAHRRWRLARNIKPAEAGFPGIRYALLHTLSHALMRQLSLECGYSAASIRERIYAREASDPAGPMAGILLYTAASDSEGTLGGLVSLGEPEHLERHLNQALEEMRLCASDPLCAEHHPYREGTTLHGAACHGCLFAPETSCERGNKYLDRALIVPIVTAHDLAFFSSEPVAK